MQVILTLPFSDVFATKTRNPTKCNKLLFYKLKQSQKKIDFQIAFKGS